MLKQLKQQKFCSPMKVIIKLSSTIILAILSSVNLIIRISVGIPYFTIIKGNNVIIPWDNVYAKDQGLKANEHFATYLCIIRLFSTDLHASCKLRTEIQIIYHFGSSVHLQE